MHTFLQSNDTIAKEWVVYTGQKDLSLVNQIKTWDNQTSLPYWSNEYANKLNGTGNFNAEKTLLKSQTISTR